MFIDLCHVAPIGCDLVQHAVIIMLCVCLPLQERDKEGSKLLTPLLNLVSVSFAGQRAI